MSKFTTFDINDPQQTLLYINHCISGVKPSAKPKLIILYGPPGSGKTFIKNKYVKNVSEYIYLSEDEYARNTVQYDIIRKIDTSELKNIDPSEIENNELVKNIMSSYKKIKGIASNITYVLTGLCLMYKYNCILEMTGVGLDYYLNAIIKEFKHSRYKIKIIYPFTSDTKLLHDRINKRSLEENRFLPISYINIATVKPIINFKKILYDDEINKIFNTIIVIDAKNYDKILYNKTNQQLVNFDNNFAKILSGYN
jgi:GTPase SAR1 family protein